MNLEKMQNIAIELRGMNSMFREGSFKNGINRSLDDTASPMIRSGLLCAYGEGDWDSILKHLKIWEQQGILKILKNPEIADPQDVCVEMLMFINRKSSIPGFLNYE